MNLSLLVILTCSVQKNSLKDETIMKLAIDAMGGDNAPKEIVLGAMKAIQHFSDIHIVLVGDEAKINSYLTDKERIEVIHTDEVILGTDEPVRAVRRKKNSSMVLATQLVADGKADACISAGNTGALMAAGLFVVGRIEGIERPALTPTLPTIGGEGFLLLDVGANVEAKPDHLLQYAIMGSIYSEKVRGISNPRVGLLNIGTEEKKGTELTKQTFELLKAAPINFVGNVEARDLLEGVADVVVTDGFTGNMVLKTIEGTALSVFKMLKGALTSSLKSKLAAAVLKPDLYQLKNKMDYSEYGGAGLFGLKAPVIKAHGSSDAQAIFSAIRQARVMVAQDVTPLIKEAVEKSSVTN
jgi:phosphate acyltransferase